MAVNDRIRHKGKPSEPFGTVGQHGVVTRTKTDGPLRIAPGRNGIPAMAHCEWTTANGDTFTSWEKLSDLVFLGGKAKK